MYRKASFVYETYFSMVDCKYPVTYYQDIYLHTVRKLWQYGLLVSKGGLQNYIEFWAKINISPNSKEIILLLEY